jgi:hypothetical protein
MGGSARVIAHASLPNRHSDRSSRSRRVRCCPKPLVLPQFGAQHSLPVIRRMNSR